MHRASSRRRLIRIAVATIGVLIAGVTAWTVGMGAAGADETPPPPEPTSSVSPTPEFPDDPFPSPPGDGSWWG